MFVGIGCQFQFQLNFLSHCTPEAASLGDMTSCPYLSIPFNHLKISLLACIWLSVVSPGIIAHPIETSTNPARKSTSTPTEPHYSAHPGSIIHIFPRYGYLSLSMRIVSRNDSVSNNSNWLFLEPSKFIFDPSTVRIHEQIFVKTPPPKFSSSGVSSVTGTDKAEPNLTKMKDSTSTLSSFQNLFHIDLCESVDQLLAAYFTRFKVEGAAEGTSWKAFAGGWQIPSVVRYFGLDNGGNGSILSKNNSNDFSFVLVRVLLIHRHGELVLSDNATVQPQFKQFFNQSAGSSSSPASAYNFFNVIGTHYISSYLAGNSLYQVYLYDNSAMTMDGRNGQTGFNAIRQFLQDINSMPYVTQRNWYLAHFPTILASWATHVGRLMILNAKASTASIIDQIMQVKSAVQAHQHGGDFYPSIFKLMNNRALVRQVEGLLDKENDGLIGLDLKMLDWVFEAKDLGGGGQRSTSTSGTGVGTGAEWYRETLTNMLILWEENLKY